MRYSLLCALLAGVPAPCQTADSPSSANESGTSKDRLFYALPNFLTLENAGKVPPLTTGQKFKVTARTAFDPANFVWFGFLAGLSQWQNSEASYGQGAEGYAKRYAANVGNGVIENFSVQAVFPSLLHQDPRYFQLGKGGFWHRTGYAVSRIWVTRTDSGGSQVNYSEILGCATASGISTFTYYPRDNRHLGNALTVFGAQLGYDALGFALKEFWPDLRRRMHKSK